MSMPAIYTPLSVTRMSTEDLRSELARAVTMTADALAFLATCWAELERRGEDLSTLRIGLAPYLRQVASGELAPEAVLAFAGKKMVLRWVSRQPIEEQKRLAARPAVSLVQGDGQRTTAFLTDLSAADLQHIEIQPDQASDVPDKKKPASTRKTVSFTVSSAEHSDFMALAKSEGRSVSDIIRGRLGLATIS